MNYKAARWILVLANSDTDTDGLLPHDVVDILGNGTSYLALFTSQERASVANFPGTRPRLLSDEEISRVVKWRRNQRSTHVAIDPTPEALNLVPMDLAFIHLEMSFDE